MIKHANELRSTSRNKSVISDEIRDIIRTMGILMSASNREGKSFIDFKVPKLFVSVGNDIDSMILIVSGTLRELIDGGYDVKIRNLEHSYLFTIRWESSLTKNDRKEIINFIKKYTVTDEDDDKDDLNK